MEIHRMRDEFDKRRRLAVDGLNSIPDSSVACPGAFCCFPGLGALVRPERFGAFGQACGGRGASAVFGAEEFIRQLRLLDRADRKAWRG
jgi:aspartate/methionine/tyrosine aminotransferase